MKASMICALVCLSCLPARAVTLIDSLASLSSYPSLTESVGYRFVVNAPVEVTSLGYFDVGGDGLASSHQVGLWNAAGTLLAQVTVVPTSSPDGGFLYAPLSLSVVLVPGVDYYLAGTVAGDAWVFNSEAFAINPAFGYVASYYAPGSPASLSFPSEATMTREYFNVNLRANVVPEPSVLALADLGIAGLLVAWKRTASRTR